MVYVNPFTKTVPTKKTGGYVNPFAPKKRATADLSTLEGLQQKATEAGLERQAAKVLDTTPKLSALQRLERGLGALNPAEAILTGKEKGLGAGLIEYPKRIIQGVGSAITGKDIGGERRYFKDVAKELGIKNGIAQFGIGFIGDVLLDPSTYFGGAIAKGLIGGTKFVGKTALKTAGKISPDIETGVNLVGTGLQDAIGKAFNYGYKSTKGAKEDVLTFLSKEQRAKLGLAASNLNRLGTGTLSKEQ